jgi:hypothetical protein
VIVLLTVGIILAVSITLHGGGKDKVAGQPFGFSDAFNSSLAPKFASVYWINGQSAYTAVESGDIVKYTLHGSEAGRGNRSVLAHSVAH